MKLFLRSIALVVGLALGAAVFPSCQKADPRAQSKTFDLTIIVVDVSTSRPVPDAKVTLHIQDGSSGRTVPLEKWTDESGICTFRDVRSLKGKVIISTDTTLPVLRLFEYDEWTDRVWEILWTELPL